MTIRPLIAVILAAGKGKRMKSDLPKVLHPLAGRPLVHYVIDLARDVSAMRIILVIGHGREQVERQTKATGVEYAVQVEQRGTADAVMAGKDLLSDFDGDLLILSGDVPLLRKRSIEQALEHHRRTVSVGTVFTFTPDDPAGYGRILRSPEGALIGIVEEKDADERVRAIYEVNAGIYIFDSRALFQALARIDSNNAAGEFYITDAVALLRNDGLPLAAWHIDDPVEVAGVNDTAQLAVLEVQLAVRRGG
ncbi:MAG: UDP-N-acetylglucosamine pyrophosphorylase [Calditrichaeota bacterium]|nr:UDP-N-acetylglucosamine pyrophosphorylase [Calditrichota bacterium]